MLINNNVLNGLINGQTFTKTEEIKRIVNDINTQSGFTKAELFVLGVELGRLHEFEAEHSTEINLCAEVNETIKNLIINLNN